MPDVGFAMMGLEVGFGLVAGFALACLGYLRNLSAVKFIAAPCGQARGVAAVIATRNEQDVIENTVRTLLTNAKAQAHVVVVDESTDATFSILEELSNEFPNLEAIRNPSEPGKPGALNAALDLVTEEVVVFLDADARVDWSFVEQYAKAFHHPEVTAVFADFSAYNRNRPLPVVFQDLFFSFAKTFAFSGLFARPIFMNCGLFIRKSVFAKVGKFDPNTIVDDFDLALRMGKKGMEVKFVLGPKCMIQYAFRIKDLFRQHCRWYTGGIKKIFAEIAQGRYGYIPVLAILGTLIYFPYIAIANDTLLRIGLPLFLSALYSATMVGYLLHGERNGKEFCINAVLGFPAIYVFFQIAIAVSFLNAFRRRPGWYKVAREKA